jgi:hypothetical protein
VCPEVVLLGLIEDVGTVATATVLAVVHGSHENTSTALLAACTVSTRSYGKAMKLRGCRPTYGFRGAFAAQTLDLAVTIDLVVLEHGKLGLLALVLDLLGSGVDLLLALLRTTAQAQNKVKRRLLLDVVVRKGTAVLKLLAGEDETLLVGGDALLVCSTVSDGHARASSAIGKYRRFQRRGNRGWRMVHVP